MDHATARRVIVGYARPILDVTTTASSASHRAVRPAGAADGHRSRGTRVGVAGLERVAVGLDVLGHGDGHRGARAAEDLWGSGETARSPRSGRAV